MGTQASEVAGRLVVLRADLERLDARLHSLADVMQQWLGAEASCESGKRQFLV